MKTRTKLKNREKVGDTTAPSDPQTREGPHELMARARRLNAAKHTQDALALLIARRGDFPRVPLAYDRAISRLKVANGEFTAGADYLFQHADAKIDRLAAGESTGRQPLKLGTALFNAGRFAEACSQLSLAERSGAVIKRLDLGLAIDAYRRAHGEPPYDTSLGRTFTLVNPEKRLTYVAIKKNACMFLKANFVLNSQYRDSFLGYHRGIHEFCHQISPPVAREVYAGPDYFKFVVLRDPFRRLVSVYLNKFVRNRASGTGESWLGRYLKLRQMEYTVRKAQASAGIDYDPVRAVSFAEFVRFLAAAEDYELNDHWTPQVRFAGHDLSLYQHVGKLENLQPTIDMLTNRFGFKIESTNETVMIGHRRHGAVYAEGDDLAAPYDALPEVLAKYEENAPHPDRFYTPELRDLVARRFAEDFDLYRRAG